MNGEREECGRECATSLCKQQTRATWLEPILCNSATVSLNYTTSFKNPEAEWCREAKRGYQNSSVSLLSPSFIISNPKAREARSTDKWKCFVTFCLPFQTQQWVIFENVLFTASFHTLKKFYTLDLQSVMDVNKIKPGGMRGGKTDRGNDTRRWCVTSQSKKTQSRSGGVMERKKMRRWEQPKQERRISDKAGWLYLTVNTQMSD